MTIQRICLLKILLNYFNAVKDVFPEEWNNSEQYILTKTTGFGALIKSFKTFYVNGLSNKTLTYGYFFEQFSEAKNTLNQKNLQLTSKYFPSNEQQQTILKNYLIEHFK